MIKIEDSCEFVLKCRKRKGSEKEKPVTGSLSEYERGRIRRMKHMIWNKVAKSGLVTIRLKRETNESVIVSEV